MSNYRNAVDNNNSKDEKLDTRVNIPFGWKPTLYMPWKRKKMSKEISADDVKMGRLLGGRTSNA